jgi:hypothetical protein
VRQRIVVSTHQLQVPEEEERLIVTYAVAGEAKRDEARASKIWKLLW